MVQQQALQAMERSSARQLILDITGVPVVDEVVARGLIQVVAAARLLGVETVVVGIRPEVAQALVALGIDLSHLTTYSSLQDSFTRLLGRQR
jgi:rsbT co-antagonist protein RsbR